MLTWKSRRSQNKRFIRGASPSIPYELWDKHTIAWRRWNIATQERKICDREVEIVTFVIKGSALLTVPLDRQEKIKVGSRGVALSRIFHLKLSGIHLTKKILKIWIIDWQYVIDVSIYPKAKTVWIPLRISIEICRLGVGHNWCPFECRLSVEKHLPRRPRKYCRLETLACWLCHLQCTCKSECSLTN